MLRQKINNKLFILVINIIILFIILLFGYNYKVAESSTNNNKPIIIKQIKPFYGIKGIKLTKQDKYYLAKITMAEAENQNIKTKKLVIMSILNRVESKDFPDSISEVIFQKSGNVYQYSPMMPNGRWYKVEPNKECYKALKSVLKSKSNKNISKGALYFESCKEADNWHSRNLKFLYQSGGLRFYK